MIKIPPNRRFNCYLFLPFTGNHALTLATLQIYNSLDFPDSIAVKYRAPSQYSTLAPAQGEA